jgi:hypothetical protein
VTTVPGPVLEYLSEVPGARGESLRAVFETVLEAMPDGYAFDALSSPPHWVIPFSTYPVTYNDQPLSYVGMIAQKQYNSLYLMGHSIDAVEAAAFKKAWAATGLRLNMGKICLRFKTLDDLDLALIARTVAAMSPEQYIAFYEQSRPA